MTIGVSFHKKNKNWEVFMKIEGIPALSMTDGYNPPPGFLRLIGTDRLGTGYRLVLNDKAVFKIPT